MIFYLVKSEHARMEYVTSWGSAPGGRMRFLYYEDLAHTTFRSGTYIFADLETLSPAQMRVATDLAGELAHAGNRIQLLNHPARVLRRYELLRVLYDSGINRFRAFRVSEGPRSLHFPVFVRGEDDHEGSLTPLLHSRADFHRAVTGLRLQGHRPRDLLVVEFCDTADNDDVFRKYSAFNVGGRILPRHLIFSRDWVVKKPDLTSDRFRREQQEYLEANPHRNWLREVFELAGIDYGRIDYGLLQGKPQIWEINTHPTIQKITPRLTSAFEEIDRVRDGENAIPVAIDPRAITAMRREAHWRGCESALRGIVPSLAATAVLRPIVRVVKTAFFGAVLARGRTTSHPSALTRMVPPTVVTNRTGDTR